MQHTVKLDIGVNTPPDAVWAVIGSFGGLAEWHPAFASCELSQNAKGQTLRTLTTANGAVIVERLLEHSDETKFYRYQIETSPMPLKHLVGELQVAGTATQSRIHWTVSYDLPDGAPAEKIIPRVDASVTSAEAALKDRFGAAD